MAKESMAAYNKTGFAASAGVSGLQEQAGQIKTDQASLRQQAEAQYQPTYEAEQRSLTNQLSALIKSQTDDSELLNTQYQQSVNTMMDKLAKRGLNIGTMPGTTEAALQKFHNEVMNQRQQAYQGQQDAIENMRGTLEGNYELNVQARMYENQNRALTSLNELLTNIAKLQASSFEDYINFLLAQKKKSSGGGGGSSRRRYYSSGGGGGSSSSAVAEVVKPASLGVDYFSGGITKPAVSKTPKTPNQGGGVKRLNMYR